MAYDITKAFERIERELISSMVRNMKKHRVEEIDKDIQWTQWQVLQLQGLDDYKRKYSKKYKKQFRTINAQLEAALIAAKEQGDMDAEIAILNALRKGWQASNGGPKMDAQFFRLNERKMDALVRSVTHDMEKAEHAVLRFAEDQYRRIIFDAQVYANSGAGTYEKAVDMATDDFLSKGINCIQYANGARVGIAAYVDMAIRTASKRAYLMGEGAKRAEWGVHTVIMNKRTNACPKCMPFEGKVLIDDVWSGGSADEGPYPLMSSAIAAGLYHPNCKDIHTTYFPGVSTPPEDKFTKQELADVEERERLENKKSYVKRQAEKCSRLADYSLDKEKQQKYRERESDWKRQIPGLNQAIKEIDDRREFEQSHRNVIRETMINKSIVMSSDFGRRIDTLEESTKIKRIIKKEIREMLKHRTGTLFEDLVFIDSKNGNMLKRIDYNAVREVQASKKMLEMLEHCEEGTVIAIHNHPGSSVPSYADLLTAYHRKYKYGLIACHDGRIFKYTVNGFVDEVVYKSALVNMGDGEYNEDVLKEFSRRMAENNVQIEVI